MKRSISLKNKILFIFFFVLFFVPLNPSFYGENVKKDVFGTESEEPEIAPSDPWKKEDLLSTQALAEVLRQEAKKDKLILLHVGFSFLYKAGHIPGSIYVGSAKDSEGILSLKQKSLQFSKESLIVIYCGCCPWHQCPNIRPAFNALKEEGFQNLKILFIPHDFAQDWIRKGYPVEKGM